MKIIDNESEMFTDKLTAFLNPKTNEISRVITEGNVKVVHKGSIEDFGEIGKMETVSF